ncbi:MAG: hypoxanthine phosphoribosyltransferase [Candidatus Sericytochromatia bacterium]|nr:hypoxanthine phosphoribosyltransferase [Candidatus Sericytochromatia bacterium]
MHHLIDHILLSETQIADRVREMGAQISQEYADTPNVLLIGVLRGVAVFFGDMMRAISLPVDVDFMSISSYGASTRSSGVVRILKDLDENITGRHVIILEDIIDTGLTLSYLVRLLQERRPASLEICTLLDKPSRRLIEVPVKYVGFTIPDQFVVGYGLDYDQKYRNLPYVGVLKPEVYSKA